MLSAAETNLLAALRSALRTRFGDRLSRLVLFGSRARGAGRDDSDLDVLVAVRELSRAERRDVVDLAADLSLESGLVLSPLVLDVDAAGHPHEGARAIHAQALREGLAL